MLYLSDTFDHQKQMSLDHSELSYSFSLIYRSLFIKSDLFRHHMFKQLHDVLYWRKMKLCVMQFRTQNWPISVRLSGSICDWESVGTWAWGCEHKSEQNGCCFADNIFKLIFFNKNICLWFKVHWSLFLRVHLFLSHFQLNDAYMHQWTRPSLVQIMVCRLVGAKPLCETMLEYC